MSASPRPAPRKRAQRSTRWIGMLLNVLLAECAYWLMRGARFSHRELDHWARTLASLALLHVCERAGEKPGRKRRKRFHVPTPRYKLRPLVGSRVRNALRGRDFCARLHAFLCFMRDLTTHVDRLEQRLLKGLTRLHIDGLRACAEACVSQASRAIVAADSS